MSSELDHGWRGPADALIAIQQTEAGVFSRMLPEKKIVAAPMSAHIQPLPAATENVFLFVGSNHAPNREGLLWFINEVWPIVRHESPDACLFVAGGICSVLPIQLPRGVVKLGHVPDLSAAYAKARVVIAPIFQG